MNTALWIVAGLLAAAFTFAGANKVLIPREKLGKAPGGGWVWKFSPASSRSWACWRSSAPPA